MRTNLPFALLFPTLLTLIACGGAETSAETTPVSDPPAPLHEPEAADADESNDDGLVVGDDLCESDADCVPAECCHAAACVAQQNAPDCQDAMCTQDCRFGTLDCGGSCLCHDGHCAARLSERPAAFREGLEAQ